MAGYINLALKRKKTKILLFAQIMCFFIMIPIFIVGLSWLDTKPISQYPTSSYEKPPEWAQYYGMNHGDPYFFKNSRKETPVRLWFFFSIFGITYIFLVASIVYVYRINKEKFPWFNIKLYEREKSNK